MGAGQVVRARMGGLGGWRVLACDRREVHDAGIASAESPWAGAVQALAQMLEEPGANAPAVSVVLSGRFVRWQLVPWHPELNGTAEVQAHARLGFRDAFGPVADGWTVLHAPQPPRRATPACAIDTALLENLERVCGAAGARLVSVAPYFSAAADFWRARWGGGAAWFGVLEDDCASLGLAHGGQWHGLHMLALDGAPERALAGWMAQIGIASGLPVDQAPLFLVGTGRPSAATPGLTCQWLDAGSPDAMPCRFALGR